MTHPCRRTLRTRLIGAEWRRRRRRTGLSPAQVERSIGADPGAIAELEAGRAVVDEVMQRYLRAVLTHAGRGDGSPLS